MTIGLASFILAAVLAFPVLSAAEEKVAPESVPLCDRELSYRGRLVHFTLSRERALETCFMLRECSAVDGHRIFHP